MFVRNGAAMGRPYERPTTEENWNFSTPSDDVRESFASF
jgi:hypothetical protein